MKELAGCKADVVLIHLNHTNPLLTFDSPERAEALAAGFKVSSYSPFCPIATSFHSCHHAGAVFPVKSFLRSCRTHLL